MKHVVKHLHFVGIGGSGMSGIAEVLLNLGYRVSGSDLIGNTATERLTVWARALRTVTMRRISKARTPSSCRALCVKTTPKCLPRARRIPVVPRALMLAELLRLRQGIAVAGTHGKTTTTSLIASALAEGGLDPTFVIGGRLNSAGANARLGAGEFIVVETDESDALFLTLSPVIEVITNIDADHMERYAYDFAQLKQAFIDFTQRLPFYGIAVLCIDDPHVRDILPGVSNKQIVRYGLAEDAQVRAVNVRVEGARMRFSVLRQNGAPAAPLEVELNLPGLHNVRNALAAIAVASELEVADEAILGALARFTGVDRRFQRYGEIPAAEGGHYTLIDDYGHHPAEIAATLAAARAAFDGRRLVLAFQPHRYTRTRDCFDDLVKALSSVDALVLTEVYSAGETPLIAADAHALARAVRVAGKVEPLFVETVEEIPEAVMRIARDGDVVITMGAGSMGGVAAQLKQHTLEMKKRDVFNPS